MMGHIYSSRWICTEVIKYEHRPCKIKQNRLSSIFAKVLYITKTNKKKTKTKKEQTTTTTTTNNVAIPHVTNISKFHSGISRLGGNAKFVVIRLS